MIPALVTVLCLILSVSSAVVACVCASDAMARSSSTDIFDVLFDVAAAAAAADDDDDACDDDVERAGAPVACCLMSEACRLSDDACLPPRRVAGAPAPGPGPPRPPGVDGTP